MQKFVRTLFVAATLAFGTAALGEKPATLPTTNPARRAASVVSLQTIDHAAQGFSYGVPETFCAVPKDTSAPKTGDLFSPSKQEVDGDAWYVGTAKPHKGEVVKSSFTLTVKSKAASGRANQPLFIAAQDAMEKFEHLPGYKAVSEETIYPNGRPALLAVFDAPLAAPTPAERGRNVRPALVRQMLFVTATEKFEYSMILAGPVERFDKIRPLVDPVIQSLKLSTDAESATATPPAADENPELKTRRIDHADAGYSVAVPLWIEKAPTPTRVDGYTDYFCLRTSPSASPRGQGAELSMIGAKPCHSTTLDDVRDETLESFKKEKNFKLIDEQKIKLDGQNFYRETFEYTIQFGDGSEGLARHRSWIGMPNEKLCLFDMAGPPEMMKAVDETADALIGSVRFAVKTRPKPRIE